MKQVTLNLYKFEELSDEVRAKIVEQKRIDLGYSIMDCSNSEYQATLAKFENIIGIKVNYEVDYCGQQFSFSWNEMPYEGYVDFTADEVKGKLLLRFLNKIYYQVRGRKYYGKLIPHEVDSDHPAGLEHVKRYSRIMWEEDNCPLTGMCYDCYILHPIMEWHKKPDWKISLEDLICECLHTFFRAWHDEYQYWCENKDNCIGEHIAVNSEGDWYYEDGKLFEGNVQCA